MEEFQISSPIAAVLHGMMREDLTLDEARAELKRLSAPQRGGDIDAVFHIGAFPFIYYSTPLSYVLHYVLSFSRILPDRLALLDYVLFELHADPARPYRYGMDDAPLWFRTPLFAVLAERHHRLDLSHILAHIVPRLLASDAPLFLPEDDDDGSRAYCLGDIIRQLASPYDEYLRHFVHALAHTPGAVRARADIASFDRGRLVRAWLNAHGACLHSDDTALDDLLCLRLGFDPAAAPRLRQAAEADEHRGLRSNALASALARHRLPVELQSTVAAHANASGPYELRVGRPATAHQLRAYTHWAHRTPTARRPPTHLLPHLPSTTGLRSHDESLD